MCSRASSGEATRIVKTAVIASTTMAMTAARTPTRPSDRDAVIDPTFATSIDIDQRNHRHANEVDEDRADRRCDREHRAGRRRRRDASASPSKKPPTRPRRTRVVSDTREC